MNKPISDKIETICKDCPFALYEGNIQKDCKIGRLDKFRNLGIILSEYVDSDGIKEFFGIPARACMFLRSPDWLSKQKTDDIQTLYEIARKEIIIQPDMALYIGKNNSIEDVVKSLSSILDMTIKPNSIVILNNNIQNIIPRVLIPECQKRKDLPKWHIEWVVEENADFNRCMDIAGFKVKKSFFCGFHAGYPIPKNYIQYIDKAINDDLERFIILLPYDDEGNGIFINNILRKQCGGNNEYPFIDKVKSLANNYECDYLIKNVKDIVHE